MYIAASIGGGGGGHGYSAIYDDDHDDYHYCVHTKEAPAVRAVPAQGTQSLLTRSPPDWPV